MRTTIEDLLRPFADKITDQNRNDNSYSAMKWVEKGKHRQKAVNDFADLITKTLTSNNYTCEITATGYYDRKISILFIAKNIEEC